MKDLRQGKAAKEYSGDYPECNFACGVPVVDTAAKADRHDERAHQTGEEEDTQPVDAS